MDNALPLTTFFSISGHTPANKLVQNLYWVCIRGLKFREYALKNSLLYLELFLTYASWCYFFIVYLVIHLPISWPKIYIGCVYLAQNCGNMPWKIHFYISIRFWDMHHYATFPSLVMIRWIFFTEMRYWKQCKMLEHCMELKNMPDFKGPIFALHKHVISLINTLHWRYLVFPKHLTCIHSHSHCVLTAHGSWALCSMLD